MLCRLLARDPGRRVIVTELKVAQTSIRGSFVDDLLATLAASHSRLKAILSRLGGEAAETPSYDEGWNVGAVMSHLGSGAQIFGMIVAAGVQGGEAPSAREFAPLWDEWNAKPSARQVRDGIVADAAFVDQLDALSPAERDGWKLDVFDATRDLRGLLLMRLTEHVLHSWDIAVVEDATATLLADAVPIVLSQLPAIVSRAAKPSSSPIEVNLLTTSPSRTMRLNVDGQGATLSLDPVDAPASGTVSLPAEALIRLVAGRLDPDHCPSDVTADGQQLDLLRSVFPGY